MNRLTPCLIAASLLAAAGPVIAQQSAAPTPQSPMKTARAPSMANSTWVRGGFETFMDQSSGHNLPAQPLERVDLANRVSTLIELGRCTEARNTAREAGDRLMALRARQMCRADRQPG